MRVPGLTFRGVAEEAGDVRTPFHVGLLGKVEIAAVRLALACERGLEVLMGLAALQGRHAYVPP